MLIHFIHGYYCIYRPWQPLTYLCFPYCISLIYFSFTKICMFLYARIYCLAEFGDVSCLQFNYLRVETHSHSHSDLGGFCQTILRVTLSSSPTKLCVRPESMIVDTLGGICISWWSVLLVKETEVHWENHRRAASQWQTLSHNVVLSTPRHELD